MTVDVLMIGTGEYTTGFVPGGTGAADKRAGVVALTLMDLRRRGRVGRLAMAGRCGTKFPDIRRHLQTHIGDVYREMDLSCDTFPADDVENDPHAWKAALNTMRLGDVVTVFTPDDTHAAIAMAAVQHGCHVLVAKPLVKSLEEHHRLALAAREHGVLVAVEVHKRRDPMYADARDRIRSLGEFSLFQSYMSQPCSQLDTFRSWAGTGSDISWYLNSHHVDFHVWAAGNSARPLRIRASAADGRARTRGIDTEDSITLLVDWENVPSGNRATAVYTASWIAPPADVHSQQRFFWQAHNGEIVMDQAHRGYTMATDPEGLVSLNPLFMKYTPDAAGFFSGQQTYGYRSIAAFIEAADAIRRGDRNPEDFDDTLATVHTTRPVTAILEAGRRSLDAGGATVTIVYDSHGAVTGLS